MVLWPFLVSVDSFLAGNKRTQNGAETQEAKDGSGHHGPPY